MYNRQLHPEQNDRSWRISLRCFCLCSPQQLEKWTSQIITFFDFLLLKMHTWIICLQNCWPKMLNSLAQVNWNTKIRLVDPPEKALQRLLQCAKVAHQLRVERRHRVPDLDHKRITEGTLLLKDQKVIARL